MKDSPVYALIVGSLILGGASISLYALILGLEVAVRIIPGGFLLVLLFAVILVPLAYFIGSGVQYNQRRTGARN